MTSRDKVNERDPVWMAEQRKVMDEFLKKVPPCEEVQEEVANPELDEKQEPITIEKLIGNQVKLLSKRSEECEDKYLADITDVMIRLFQLYGD